MKVRIIVEEVSICDIELSALPLVGHTIILRDMYAYLRKSRDVVLLKVLAVVHTITKTGWLGTNNPSNLEDRWENWTKEKFEYDNGDHSVEIYCKEVTSTEAFEGTD